MDYELHQKKDYLLMSNYIGVHLRNFFSAYQYQDFAYTAWYTNFQCDCASKLTIFRLFFYSMMSLYI